MSQPEIGQVAIKGPMHLDGIEEGVTAYASAHGNWRLLFGAGLTPAFVCAHEIQGVIAQWRDAAERRRYRRLGRPLVNVLDHLPRGLMPSVEVDDHAVGRLAADFWADRGYRHVACFTLPAGSAAWARRRLEGLRRGSRARGLQVHRLAPIGSMHGDDPLMREQIRALPASTGIFVVHDLQAYGVMWCIASVGRAIPEELSVLGVDNDTRLCRGTRPALSSIALPAFDLGWRAAELLHRLLRGESVAAETILLPPLGVVTRDSTSLVGTDDPLVARALALIQAQRNRHQTVNEISRQLETPRRTLQQRFRDALGRGVLEVLMDLRHERACRLLADGQLPIAEVAARAGCPDVRALIRLIRSREGCTPGEYRRRRGAAPAG